MPRQSRGRSSSSSRAAPAPAAPAQTRSAHSAAAPSGFASPAKAPPVPAAAAAPSKAGTKQPGMIAQMAATAGSVAIGSTIGHGLSSMLFGGRSEPAPAAPAPAQAQQYNQTASCEVQAKDFTQCLEKADLPSCTWYLEQLKACQAAAAPY